MKTRIKFLIDTYSKKVFAFFPDMLYNENLYSKDMKTCYAHLGQHSACLQSYADVCKEANYNEYESLLKELIQIGYNPDIINIKQSVYLHRQPTKGEIKFGQGATHYRSFLISELINNKGELRQWIKADDGLRYYRN